MFRTGSKWTTATRSVNNPNEAVSSTSEVLGTTNYRGRTVVDVLTSESSGVIAHMYQAVVDGFIEGYGGTVNIPGADYYYDPVFRYPTSLAEGASYTNSHTLHQSGGAVVPTTMTMTYVGRETVTVPAGTFETCRMRMDLPGGPTPYWFNSIVASGPYRGIMIKQVIYNAVGTIDSGQEATAISASFK